MLCDAIAVAGGSSTAAAMEIGRLNAVLAIGVFVVVYASVVEICEGNRVPEKFIVGR